MYIAETAMRNVAAPVKLVDDIPARRATGDGGAERRVLAEIARLNLERNVADLDERGYTILSPAQAAPPGFCERVRDKIFDVVAEETGLRPELSDGDRFSGQMASICRGATFSNIFFADPIFEQVMMSEAPLALVTYLLGESCEFAAMNAVIKAPGAEYLNMHVDSPQPAPLPPYSQVANATWLLNDYDAANGATVMVPGSHRWCRHPVGEEVADVSNGIVVKAPAGSILIWHGNTWHAALPRTAPGIRVSLITYFVRHYLRRTVSESDSKLSI
jgi:hypothetical protein